MYKVSTVLASFLVTTLFLAGCDVNMPLNVGGTPGSGSGHGDPPNADVGALDRNVAVGSRVMLDATTSSDPDGDLVTCRWQQGSGPVTVDIQTAPGNDCDAYVVPTIEGVYQFIVTVSDGGNSDSQTVEVRVGPDTWPEGVPFADAGVDQTVNEGNNVTLRGGNSADPDGDPLSFEWFQLAGLDVSLSNKFIAEPTFTAPMVDRDTELVFNLSVNDGVYSSTDTVVVTVLDRFEVGVCESDDDCDDGLFCNGFETCLAGECLSGDDPCPDLLCDEATDTCEVGPDCDDNADCDDGLFCNGAETCVDGECVSGDDPCPGLLCNEATDTCEEGPDCTTNADCDDALFCNGEETCVEGDCVPGTHPCTPDEICDEDTDECVLPVECATNGDCDDGLFCNGAETCDTSGVCQAGDDPCPGQLCRESDDQCVDCLIDSDCDEGYDCVDGLCTQPSRGQLVVGNGTALTALALDEQTVRWEADAGCNGRLIVVPDGDQSVVLVECSSQTVAFDGVTGAYLWTRNEMQILLSQDVYGQLYTDRIRYPYGPPNLGGGSAPDILLFSSDPPFRTTYLVDSRTGEEIWSRTESSDTRGFQFLATTSGSYDVVFGSAGAAGGMFKVDGPTGTFVIWSRPDLQRRWGIPVPDVNGDGQYDFFAAPSYYSNIVMMLDGASGDDIWTKDHGSFDIMGSAVVDDATGLGVIVGAQGGPLARRRASDGEIVWSDSVHTNNTIMGLMERTDGLTVLSGWRHQGKAVAVDAATGNVLWDDTRADNADFVGIGVPDLTADGSDDFLPLNAGWLRLYDGVSGAEQTWFAPIPASTVAYDSVP